MGGGWAGGAQSMLYGSLLALSKLPIPQRPPGTSNAQPAACIGQLCIQVRQDQMQNAPV